MAGIGMYGVFYAKATVQAGVVTGYTGGTKRMGKAISAEFTPNTPEDNPLYANNGVGENDASGASGGSITMTLDRMTMDTAADLYGLEVEEATVMVAGKPVTGRGLRYKGNEQSAPVGVAYIRMNQEDGVRGHEVVLYRRGTFAMPSQSSRTMEKSIEWQTPEIEGTIMGMEGDGTEPWYQTFVFPSQEAAIAYIESIFGPLAEKTTAIVGQGAAGYAKVADEGGAP